MGVVANSGYVLRRTMQAARSPEILEEDDSPGAPVLKLIVYVIANS